jgi:hypothetical protein
VAGYQFDGEFSERETHQRGASFVAAVAVHVLIVWALAYAISSQLTEPPEPTIEPRVVLLAPPLVPPPPSAEQLGPVDVVMTVPRFRPRTPRAPAHRDQKRSGDPRLAIWKYLCNRDPSLGVAVQRNCPFDFGSVDLSASDPLNRTGDIGALLGADTTTMSLEEAGRAKGWFKPKAPWPGDGARAKGDSLGLPGHDPFAILPGR